MSVVSPDFKFEVDSEGLASRCYRSQMPSEAATYGLGDRVLIPIPPVHNGFLDCSQSFLNIAYTATITGTLPDAANAIHLSSIGAYSCISELNVLCGGRYIQQMRNHQQIMAVLFSGNLSQSACLPASATSGIPNLSIGNEHFNGATTVAGGAIALQDFSIPLVGVLSSVKHLPLWAIGEPLVIELILASDIRQMYFSGVHTTTITGGTLSLKCDYDAAYIVVNDNAIREVQDASDWSSGQIVWSDTQLQCSNNTVSVAELNAAGTTTKQTLIGGIKPRQLLAVLHSGFSATIGINDPWEGSSYWSNDLRFRLGSQEYPPRPISGVAECRQHLNDCFDQTAVPLYNSVADQSSSLSYRPFAPTVANALTDTSLGGSGYNFSKFVDTADGMDSTDKQLITEVSLLINPSTTALVPINAATIKRFGVVYSVSRDGQFSVSY